MILNFRTFHEKKLKGTLEKSKKLNRKRKSHRAVQLKFTGLAKTGHRPSYMKVYRPIEIMLQS